MQTVTLNNNNGCLDNLGCIDVVAVPISSGLFKKRKVAGFMLHLFEFGKRGVGTN